jgi:superfamily I DNA/RNA helicase
MDEVVKAVLKSRRGLVVAAAGCGKTELIARTVAHERAGRQLVLTHTHAGVAALKRRFEKLGVQANTYHLDTIAGWSLRYGTAYPEISELENVDGANPAWKDVYPGAREVVAARVGKRVIAASYDGVLVDEYQDCSLAQHAVIAAVADILPVRVVGDPLQAIFGFRQDDPMVKWSEVEDFFERLPDLLTPYRWKNANAALGDWLTAARLELLESGGLTISRNAPVAWEPWTNDAELEACRSCEVDRGVVAIKRWPRGERRGRTSAHSVATRLGGRFQVVEAFDDDELPALAERWATAAGHEIVADLLEYARERTVRVGPRLNDLVTAISAGRSTSRFINHLEHRDRLETLAKEPTAQRVLAVLDGFASERGWTIYRPEGMYQLRSALRECEESGLTNLPGAVANVRAQARHRGRHVPWRTLGTTLLVKGLEFGHAMVLDADEFSRNELYVAITRGASSLRVMSKSRTISCGT